MRAAVFGVVVLAACASPPRVPQPRIPPPRLERTNVQEQRFRQPTDEAATERFLDQEIERRRAELPVKPPEVVERTVYVEVPRYYESYEPYERYYHRGYPTRRPRGEPLLPINTAIGAGVGAIIGHQSGHRGRGAAIGASIGFLSDLARWGR